MDPDAAYALMINPLNDIDERAVAATDLLVWMATGGYGPDVVETTASLAEKCQARIFVALDRLAEYENREMEGA